MNHLSLFSGIGGLDLAAEWAGFKTVGFVEFNPFCQAVLRKHWPNVPIISDIREVTKKRLATDGIKDIKILSGGFPCQPFSHAGKRTGKVDNRYLWPEMLRVIREVKPTYVVGENVYGLVTNMGGTTLEVIYTDLDSAGYEVVPPIVFPAASVGALHRRDRVWICAHARHDNRSPEQELQQTERPEVVNRSSGNAIPKLETYPSWSGGKVQSPCPVTEVSKDKEVERNFRGVAHGISRRVDRFRALGNAVVPQQAFQVFLMIAQLDEMLERR